jgi:hypothetical protein
MDAKDFLSNKLKNRRKELFSVPLDTDTVDLLVQLSSITKVTKTQIARLAIQYALQDDEFLKALEEI